MKRFVFLLLAFSLVCAVTVSAQNTDDPVIMTIGPKKILRSEFEYSYNKNNTEGTGLEQKTVAEYVDLFINYKLKVCEAERLKLDTLASFKNEFQKYREIQLVPLLIDSAYVDSVAREVYAYIEKNMNGKDLVHVAHIFIPLSQRATDAQQRAAKMRIDSLYTLLQSGRDFAELAKACSEDRASAKNGGLLPWFGPGATLKEFENVAYALKTGEMSQPFLSTVGYHIIKMYERKPLEPYAEKKNEIVAFLEKQGINERASESQIQKLIRRSGGKLTREDILDNTEQILTQNNPTTKYLIQEYYDGLLLYEVSNREVWSKAANDVPGLTQYFKKNKKKYAWDSPHFKGFAFKTKNEDHVKVLKKFFKKADVDNWKEAYRKQFANDTLNPTQVTYGIFKQGDNAIVDEYFFGASPSEKNVSAKYPYAAVQGKKLKKPKTYTDVKALVVADYQEQKEQEWVEKLRKNYTVQVHEDVVKTVNNHPQN